MIDKMETNTLNSVYFDLDYNEFSVTMNSQIDLDPVSSFKMYTFKTNSGSLSHFVRYNRSLL